MRRRELIAGLGSTALWPAAGPLAAQAQQAERIRRVGVLMNLAEDDPEAPLRVRSFERALQGLGWIIGRNLQVDYRWGAGDAETYRRYAAELVMLMPDVAFGRRRPGR